MAIRAAGFGELHEWYTSTAVTLTQDDTQAQFPFQQSFLSSSTGTRSGVYVLVTFARTHDATCFSC
jgi:hypothetical protein